MSFVRMNKKVLRPASSSLQAASENPPSNAAQTPSGPATPAPTPAKEQSRGPVVSSVGSIIRVSKSATQATAALGVAATNIPGTRAWVNGHILTSTGLPQWDTVMGGGIPLGSLVTIVPDNLTSFYKEFSKAFISEGMVHGHTVVVALPETITTCEAFVQSVRVSNRRLAAAAIQAKTLQGKAAVNITGVEQGVLDTAVDEKDIFEEDDQQGDASANATQGDQDAPLTTGAVKAAMRGEGVSAQSKLKIAWRYEAYSNALDAGGNLSGSNTQSLYEPSGTAANSTNGANDGDKGAADGNSSRLSSSSDVFCLSTLATSTESPAAPADDDFAAIFRAAAQKHASTVVAPSPSSTSTPTLSTPASVSPLRAHFTSILSQVWTVLQRAKAYHHVAFLKLQQQQQTDPERDQDHASSGENTSSARPAASVCRIVLDCFRPHTWPAYNTSASSQTHGNIVTSELMRFFHSLRGLCHSSNTVVYCVTPPPHLISPALLASLHRLSDISVSVQSFSDSLTPSPYASAFGDYDGMLTLYKLPRQNSLQYTFPLPDTLQYLFKLRNKTLEIQRLALPPETSRTPAAPTVTQSGGAFDAYLDAGSSPAGRSTDQSRKNTGHADAGKVNPEVSGHKLGKGVSSLPEHNIPGQGKSPENSGIQKSGNITPMGIRARTHNTLALARSQGIDDGIDMIAEEGEEDAEEEEEASNADSHARRDTNLSAKAPAGADHQLAPSVIATDDEMTVVAHATESSATNSQARGVRARARAAAAAKANTARLAVTTDAAQPSTGAMWNPTEKNGAESDRKDRADRAITATNDMTNVSLFDRSDEEIVKMMGIIGNPNENSDSDYDDEYHVPSIDSSSNTTIETQATTPHRLPQSTFDMLSGEVTRRPLVAVDAGDDVDAAEHVDELEEEAEKQAAERVGETTGCGSVGGNKDIFASSKGGYEDMF